MNSIQLGLKGLRVLNTRPWQQGNSLTQSIQAAGGVCLELPALCIEPTTIDWLKHMPDLTRVNQAIFISTNAVHFYFDTLEQQRITWPQTIDVIAIGKASALALAEYDIKISQLPTAADSENLLLLETLQQVKDKIVLLIKGEGGRPIIADTLLARGALLTSLSVYRRGLPEIPATYINSIWQDDQVDIILFTSQQAMHNLFILFGDALPWLCSKPCVVISKRLAEEASSLGMQTVLISRYDTLLNSLYHYNQGLIYGN